MKKYFFQNTLFIRLMHWEYWPFNIVYVPVYVYWFWLAVKARSFFFFSTSNPTIRNAGFLMESKKEIYDLIPEQYYPATLFVSKGINPVELLEKFSEKGFKYPVICKPDIGMQGKAVMKIHDEKMLLAYLDAATFDFLVQEFIPYENEVGLFYYRIPGETNGKISGIVAKEFLSVTGDGISSIETLMKKDKRSLLQMETLRKLGDINLETVPGKNEIHILVPYGNHVRGAKFIDISNKADEILNTTVDTICKQIDGFYFGRLDIRYDTWESLKQGKDFSIIELNGAGSEPTHIYDPKHSIFFAWKEIILHLDVLYTISRINRKKMGLPYMKLADGLKMFRDNNMYVKKLNAFSINKEVKPS